MFYNRFSYSALLLLTLLVTSCQIQPEKPTKEDRIDLAVAMEIEITKDLKLGYVPKERLYEANLLTHQLKKSASRSQPHDLNWIERGPDNVGGRTRAMFFDLRDTSPSTVIAGSVAGGIWRCEDIFSFNPIWTNLTPDLSNLAISALAQDPTNPEIMYAGTGEGWFNGDAVRGIGILKSIDGGLSWTRLPSTSGSAFRYTQKLTVDQQGLVYACTRARGLQKSADQGDSWEKILGSNVGGFSDRAADFEIGPDGTMYAALGVYSIDGLYRSLDSGATWDYLHGNGMPEQGYRRIEVAVAPSDSNRVYAILEATDGSCLGIYRSEDKGDSWVSLPIPTSESGLTFGRNQLWYDLTMTVDAADADHVVIGAVNLFRSANGGDVWIQLSNWFSTAEHPYVHADQHFIIIDEDDPSRALFANDGGLFSTTNFQFGAPQFNHPVHQYNVTQYYSCAIHPENPEIISGGTQDNGTQLLTSDEHQTATKISGGDGGFTHFAGEHGEYLISSFTNNDYNVYFENDLYRRISFEGGSFINPTAVDKKIMYGNADNGEYFRVDVTDLNASVEHVYVDAFNGRNISAVYVSPNIENRVYFGFSDGRVVYVDDAHTGLDKPGVEIFNRIGTISSIAIEDGNEDHALVTISNYGEVSVHETRNGGQFWLFAENNIPDMPVRWAIFAPGRPQEVLLATEAGIWRTDSIKGPWTEWFPDPTFPAVRVDMIKKHEASGRVVVGTHGRGIFVTDDYSIYVSNKDVKSPELSFNIYPNPTVDKIHLNSDLTISGNYFIFSINGTFESRGELNDQTSIPVDHLVPGTYILQLESDQGQISKTFIKV